MKATLLDKHALLAGQEVLGQAVDPWVLWDLCYDERSSPHLSDLIRLITALASDELQRLLRALRPKAQAVVSTIHKVKGLEYDNVIIVPSPSGFGDRLQGEALEMEAAEKARLFYVAMTRAKSRLVYFQGDRERAWGSKTALQSVAANTSVKVLEGDGTMILSKGDFN
ncbi:MAG: helicase [Devosia sp.]|nr:helicase [Devosia sp.]